MAAEAKGKPFFRTSYGQVLIAVILAIAVGLLFPDFAKNPWVKAMGDGFIKLIKMIITPLIFCTVVSGIAHMQDARKVGRVGVKALVYFEVVSTLALILGLIAGNLIPIGRGMEAKGDASTIANFATQAADMKPVDMVLHVIPDTVVGAFASGDILQVLLFSILFGFALMFLGERGRTLRTLIDDVTHTVFGIVAIIVKVAPLGVFGALAFTVARFGAAALGNLIELVLLFYATVIVFIFLVLGITARMARFSIWQLLVYIRNELLLVLGTGVSEAALPILMEKLERLGCSKSVVGLVVPTGYTFNLAGTNVYMTLATLFIAQVLGVDLTLLQQIIILGVAMLTSKGSAGITGAGFITLYATLAVINPQLAQGMAIVFGVDQFMSRGRGLTNMIGNAVAAVVVSRWENEIDPVTLAANMHRQVDAADVKTAVTTG
jgi:aerobic C4-dicarboxylate transport protein